MFIILVILQFQTLPMFQSFSVFCMWYGNSQTRVKQTPSGTWTGLVMTAKWAVVIKYITEFKGRHLNRNFKSKNMFMKVNLYKRLQTDSPLSHGLLVTQFKYQWPHLENIEHVYVVRRWMSFPCSVHGLRPLRCYSGCCSTRLRARSSQHTYSKRDLGHISEL